MFKMMNESTPWLTRGLFIFLFSLFAVASHADEDYLKPEEAFKFSAKLLDAKTVEVNYLIADGYYMYRERLRFRAAGATLGEPVLPAGKVKFDETFQKDVETYRKSLTVKLPVNANGAFTLTATGQGCADKGLCYPPMDSEVRLAPQSSSGLMGAVSRAKDDLNGPIKPKDSESRIEQTPQQTITTDSDLGKIESSLKTGKLIAIVPLFLLLGLGLALTPCVLPMIPILSVIIVGEGPQVSRKRGFILSLMYSLGMALIYTILGIAAGLIGEGLSATLQNPWVLGAFSLLMVGLSLSMFGAYQLQVPEAIQMKLINASEKQSAGKLLGVFVMGALSALIVGPCVAAPLAGALVYISQTRDVLIGGIALFAMAVGMSVPLILVGVSAGALLPRAGVWMEAVKRFFGVLMLAMALWMISPVIPAIAQMLAWAALGVGYGAYMVWPKTGRWPSKTVGVLFAAFGMMQLFGVASGGRDALAPLAHLMSNGIKKADFIRVKSSAELDALLAKAAGKTVMLDFYADWCVSCKEMEKLTFSDPQVQAQFSNMLLLQADVTANNADDKALLNRFRLFGPPGIIFFGRQGEEIQGSRVIGYQDSEKFLRSLTLAARF
jgi:thiol:disulfide interchange protein DsbD